MSSRISAAWRKLACLIMSGLRNREPLEDTSPRTQAGEREERRLAAIMFTDMVGYTSLAQSNEARALALLDEHKRLLRPILSRHHGREVKTIGDAFLVEFASALEATNCAVDMQR